MKYLYCLAFLLAIPFQQSLAQTNPDSVATVPAADTISDFFVTDSAGMVPARGPDKQRWYQNKWVRASAVPAALIGYGLSVRGDRGLYSSVDAQRDIHGAFPDFFTRLDYGVVMLPYAGLLALNLSKLPCQSDFINTSLIVLKSEALLLAIVFPLKEITNEMRPNGENNESMPSGHTAQAFLAASIVHRETRHISRWYGVGAYGVATSVAGFRMLNNKHWQSDVFVGAGIGIMVSHITYLTHKYRFGRPGLCIVPAPMPGGGAGLVVNYQFK